MIEDEYKLYAAAKGDDDYEEPEADDDEEEDEDDDLEDDEDEEDEVTTTSDDDEDDEAQDRQEFDQRETHQHQAANPAFRFRLAGDAGDRRRENHAFADACADCGNRDGKRGSKSQKSKISSEHRQVLLSVSGNS